MRLPAHTGARCSGKHAAWGLLYFTASQHQLKALDAVVWWCLLQHVAYSWGWGLCGQLGHGEFVQAQPTPRQITALSAGGDDSLADGVIAISAGGIHSAAVDLKGKAGGEAAGSLMCVGRWIAWG